jgi:hypothetical protein
VELNKRRAAKSFPYDKTFLFCVAPFVVLPSCCQLPGGKRRQIIHLRGLFTFSLLAPTQFISSEVCESLKSCQPSLSLESQSERAVIEEFFGLMDENLPLDATYKTHFRAIWPECSLIERKIHSYFILQIAGLIILSLLPVALSQSSAASLESKADDGVRVKRAGFSLITGALQVSICHLDAGAEIQFPPSLRFICRTCKKEHSLRQRLPLPEAVHNRRVAHQDRLDRQARLHLVMKLTATPTVMTPTKNHIT